jgi:hypothetical protein
MNKKSIIVGLVGLNLFLLACLILASYDPPAANAQSRGGRAGDFLMVTVEIHEDYDALAIINVPLGVMHIFVPRETKVGATLTWTDTRNLNLDFGRIK